MFYKENINFCFKSKLVDKLLTKLRKLIIFYKKKPHHAQKLQKRAYNKGIKAQNYTSSNKVCLNTKYIKIKQSWNLKAKFFKPFQNLHSVGK